ncbi:hypothetical protein CCP1ISM_450001 [Azospirillaceae bacterium]
MLSKLWPFNKKKKEKKSSSYVAAIVGMTHKNGEEIKIRIEGQTPEVVAHVANRIRSSFGMKVKEENKILEEMDKVWEESDRLWESFDKAHKKVFKKF